MLVRANNIDLQDKTKEGTSSIMEEDEAFVESKIFTLIYDNIKKAQSYT